MLKKINTGIFRHLEISEATKADIGVLQEQLTKSARIENWLTFFETKANESPDSQDAKNVLAKVRGLSEALEVGNLELVAIEALQLGILGTILETRRHEREAVSGQRIRRVTQDNRDSEELRLAKERKREEHRQWAICAKKYLERNPCHSLRVAAAHVARELQTSQKPDTIRRKLRELLK